MADLKERFLAKVKKSWFCWEWIGAIDPNGYGRFRLDGKTIGAHRATYIIFVGPIPKGYVVDHVRAKGCRRKNCVRPSHLEAVPQRINVLRGDAAPDKRCRNGHLRIVSNTYINRGRRECKVCRREAVRRSKKKKDKKIG